ncbi:MAG: hypothetical protein AAF390_11330, partial [Pseudomonadota bacterium]
MFRSCLVSCFVTLALAATSAARAEAEVAPRHQCPTHWSAPPSGDRDVDYRLADIWTPFDAPLIEQVGTVAFTDRPGTFLNINCIGGARTPTERHEFYPIGMILKPLRVLTLSDEQTDTFVGGDGRVTLQVPRTYLLVLTEFGHLKVIRERDVQYMISGATYFFAQSNTPVYLCDDAADCPGNQRLAYDADGAASPVCDRTRCREGTAIEPLGGYAVGSIAHIVDGEPRTDWSRVLQARRTIRDRGATRVDQAVIDAFCRPFRAKAYRSGGRPALPSADAEYLTLCIQRGAAERPPLRAIDKDRALAIFDDMAEGLFFRRFGRNGASIKEVLLPSRGPEGSGRKECAQAVEQTGEAGIESEAGWGLDWWFFSAGQKATVTQSSTLTNMISDAEYVRFSNYVAPGDFGARALGTLDDGTGVFNLVFIADCEGQLVTAAKAVALDHPSFFD